MPSIFVLVGYMTIAINHDRFDYLITALRTAVDGDQIAGHEQVYQKISEPEVCIITRNFY